MKLTVFGQSVFWFTCALAVSMLLPRIAYAHRLHVFVFQEGGQIRGQAYFQDGSPLRGGQVKLLDETRNPLAVVPTNEEGEFSLPVPRPGKYTVLVDAGFGHMAEQQIDTGEGDKQGQLLKESLGTNPASDAQAGETAPSGLKEVLGELRAVKSELAHLRAALERQNNRTRIQDILGGAGYILGVMAIVYLVKAAKRRTVPQ
ncbi:MAG: carboxypeptidase-like regulatory domain-containing protein [Thermoguttaceae bacterium]|nr:carboxypeptidase-like regulatory domain-containing protein [Thermoguttaceae bacterium]